jgi:short-subunit dehydrogenase involved in D-alanine esterification of teichoic acids
MRSAEATPAVNYLIFAIGIQESNEIKAETWFNHAKNSLVANLTASMHLTTVQGFALVAVYLLRAFQPNGAYLYFCTLLRITP